MEETKEKQKNKKEKHGEKPTIGDIIFRILIILAIFFIAVISYVFYITGIEEQSSTNKYTTQEIIRPIDKSN